MDTVKTEQKFDFETLLKPLEKQIKTNQLNYEDFKQAYDSLNNAYSYLQELLEYANQVKKDAENFKHLYRRISGRNSSELIEKLRRLGYKLCRENADLKEAFENSGYRLLEQTRAGKRDDVFYGILRIFISTKKDFPKNLNEPFKPIYSDEMFKVMIFSFLSGILGKESENE